MYVRAHTECCGRQKITWLKTLPAKDNFLVAGPKKKKKMMKEDKDFLEDVEQGTLGIQNYTNIQ